MLEFVILALVCLIGFCGGGTWIILVGATGLCIGPFSSQLALLKQQPRVSFDGRMAMFFAGVVVIGVIASTISYLSGVAGRAIMD